MASSLLVNSTINTLAAEDYQVSAPTGTRIINLDADDLAESVRVAFSTIQDGDTIVFPAGYYSLSTQIKVVGNPLEDGRLKDITIMGAGVNETIIDFSGLPKGSKGDPDGVDGLLLSDIDNLVISDLTVAEAGKNAIKVEHINGLHMHHLATIWDGELVKENGAYGIYPVNSENILIENTYTRGSADAGVYVGQSKHVIVRNSVAYENVAGMEIENCEDAEFYGNIAEKNTAGLLVFDLPIGGGKYGSNVRVYNNVIKDNNTPNFATVSDFAGGVHIVPHGTGMIVLSTSDVEIFDNDISDHKSFAVAVADYGFAESPADLVVFPDQLVDAGLVTQTKYKSVYEDGYSPLVKNITIHDNNINNSGYEPDPSKLQDFITLYNLAVPDQPLNTLPEMIYMGLDRTITEIGFPLGGMGALPLAPWDQTFTEDESVCAYDNTNTASETVVMGTPYNPFAIAGWELDGDGNPVDMNPSPSITEAGFVCGQTRPSLAKTVVTINNVTYGCGTDDTTSPGCTVN